MQNETYAVIEITKKYIKFAVGKYKKNMGLKVVFKEREKTKNSWLTEKNDIVDTNIVSHRLNKMINKYESMFKEKIKRVSVIYPTASMQIKDSSSSLYIDNPDKIIRKEHLTILCKDAKRVVFEDNLVFANMKPYEFRINNSQSFANMPYGAKAELVSMNAKVYAAERHVVDSFNKVLKSLELETITASSQMFTLAKQCGDGLNFRNTFALINWDWDSIDIGFFSRETLVKKEVINFGIKDIIENLSAKMYSKFDIADKYIFKLLDFSSNRLDNNVMYRKYIASERKIFELKAIDLKHMLLEELNAVIDKSDVLISREMNNIRNFKVYHTGKITEIAGFEKILLRSNYKNISEIYYSLVTGASQIWTTSLCGMMKHLHLTNKNLKEIKTSTEIYLNSEHPANRVEAQQMVYPNQVRPNQHLQQTQQFRPNVQQNYQQSNQYSPQMMVQQNYQKNENYLKNGIINTQTNKQ
ncbi:cell division protein FtsA [Spiroplasma diminutum]|uniref:Cell division protein FtsA n=1 Tax=Spiroplasma diminutum CUAS-1 TaxID=1276221 RepID=S5M2M2_9MOLU|nr:cell division protein FtsA [Spiroplasma diminutum]AGR42337.1 cell division protein FtsA [Spiroplasma diminutum CUAS-1]